MSVTYRGKQARQSYCSRVGTRSLLFQIILLAWTVLMVFVAIAMASLTYAGTSPRKPAAEVPMFASAEQFEEIQRQQWELHHPQAVREQRIMALIGAVTVPAIAWFVVALPLGIAAVATLEKSHKGEISS